MKRKHVIVGLMFAVLVTAIWADSRESIAPRTIPGAPRVERSAEEWGLIEAIGNAKLAGDSEAIARLEAKRATLLGRETMRVDHATAAEDIEIVFYDTGGIAGPAAAPVGGERWYPGDIRLSNSERNEWEGVLGADQEGTLFEADIEVDEGGETDLDIYRSFDGGATWTRFLSITDPPPSDVTLTVADGTERALLVAWVSEGYRLSVLRVNLDDHGDYFITNLFLNGTGIVNPRIVTDSPEYEGWYGYVIFNIQGLDNWFLLTSRTTDYAMSWEPAHVIGYYCGHPDSFYDASEAYPDIAVGSQNVYVAYDNYPPPCTTTNRDIFILKSEDFGATYDDGVQVTDDDDDEFQPSMAAVKGFVPDQSAVVAYTRFYHELDDDVWYVTTQDGGATWSADHCIQCTTDYERYASLVASDSHGYIHAGYWDSGYLAYERAIYDDLSTWLWQRTLTDDGTLSQWYPIDTTIDPTQDPENEFCAAWTDLRFLGSYGYDIYYNSAGLPDPYAAVEEKTVTGEVPTLQAGFTPGGGIVLDFALPAPARIGLQIIDATGRRVANLCDDEVRAAGGHQVTWDGRDSAGQCMAAGIYYGRLTTDDHQVCERLLTLR